jgi:alpha-1,3-mannosyltransferase
VKVIHVVRQFWPCVGGLEEGVLNLCRATRERGLEVEVVTLDRSFRAPDRTLPPFEVHDGITIRRIPFRGSRRYPLAPSVLRHLRGADVVHVHAIDFFFDFLALTRDLHRRPMVASTHGGFFHTTFAQSLKAVYFGTVTRLAARRYDAICASSEADAQLFARITPGNLVTIENGVDIGKFRNMASGTYRRHLISFGRLAPNKGLDRLFPLLRALREREPEWRLTVAGGEDGVTVEELRGKAARAGVAEAVRFVADPSNAELAALIGEASFFLSLSEYEGFGLTTIEALSAGLVPILSPIPTFTSFVQRGGVGLLADPERPEESAAAIVALDARVSGALPEEKGRVMQAAQRYDWGAIADRFVAQYRAASAGSARTHAA